MPPGSIAKKVALVTGGASGIGEACVRSLRSYGASVMIADLDLASANKLAAELGPAAEACELDVSDSESARLAVTATVQRFGHLDLAVNSAGVGMPQPCALADLDDDQWRRVTSVDLDGVFFSMRAELQAMLSTGSGGSIVNVASVMGLVAAPLGGPYVSAKHGVVGLTKVAALEYAKQGIRVNAVCPGHVRTAMFAAHPADRQRSIEAMYPTGRIGEPGEIAEFVCFLLSADASFANGGAYTIDGALTAM